MVFINFFLLSYVVGLVELFIKNIKTLTISKSITSFFYRTNKDEGTNLLVANKV